MKKIKMIEDYFNPPMFNWFYKWSALENLNLNVYVDGGTLPSYNKTQVLWKSRRTGKVVKKIYNYQVKV